MQRLGHVSKDFLRCASEDGPGHVIAPFFQLHHRPTIVASLPTSLFSCLEKSVRLLILRAILHAMPLAIAKTADLGRTPTAFPILLAIFSVYISRLDPFATSSGRTIYTILGGVFCKFRVPGLFKLVVKEPFDMFEWYVVGSAAFGGHVLGISDRKLEDTLQAGVAHAMTTF